MTERERLIELITEARHAAKDAIGSMNDYNAWIADHLLEHGVIVMPVNVGQPVWVMSPDKRGISRAKPAFSTIARWVERGDFGKYVFATREEAEAALAERR